MDPSFPAPPPSGPSVDERCYRHPDVVTGVHCTRCGRAICTDCMLPAPVGHQCPECVKGARQEFRRPGQRISARPSGGRTLTTMLLGLLVAVYAAEVAVAGPGSLISGPSGRSLIDLGGSVGVLIAGGETWRMFTATFLHIGIFHLAMNGYALYLFGNLIEAEEGKVRFGAIYLVTGLAASAASYAFGPPSVVSAGASGAIFGLFGAFLGVAWVKRDMAFYAARLRSATSLILLNVFIMFAFPGIDWRAHLGGLVAGLALGVTVAKNRTRTAVFAAVCGGVLAVAVGLTIWRTADLRSTFGF
ncbi:MAG: rhomboid family intramembrane serine protease [Actinomycetota bacterium]